MCVGGEGGGGGDECACNAAQGSCLARCCSCCSSPPSYITLNSHHSAPPPASPPCYDTLSGPSAAAACGVTTDTSTADRRARFWLTPRLPYNSTAACARAALPLLRCRPASSRACGRVPIVRAYHHLSCSTALRGCGCGCRCGCCRHNHEAVDLKKENI